MTRAGGGPVAHLLFLLVGGLSLASACEHDASVREEKTTKPNETHFVGEWFTLADGARCRVDAPLLVATEALADGQDDEEREPRTGARRVPEDLLVLDVPLVCEDARQQPLPSDRALPDDALVTLEDGHGRRKAASPRTRHGARVPGHFLFEVSAQEPLILRTRRFDLRTGAARFAAEKLVGRVRLESRERRLDVHLRDPLHTAAVDVYLGRLARALALGTNDAALVSDEQGSRALAQLRAITSSVRERLDARELALVGLSSVPGELRLALAFDGSPQHDAPSPLARVELVLHRQGDSFVLTRLVEGSEVASAVACAEEKLALEERVERAYREQPVQTAGAECNVLGVLLPGACDAIDTSLRDRILSVRPRCAPELMALAQRGPVLPQDFQLTLRRGSNGSGLDRAPRYVLSLFANGSVVFHGRHWVTTTERSDGRTAVSLLRGLFAHLQTLDWFDRKGGSWDPEHCSPEDEPGSVLTVHAGERERMVVDRSGCRGAFSEAELKELLRMIAEVAGVSAWTTPRPSYADRRQQVWTVP